MNASYKIVLLGAFTLFAAVVGYAIFSGGDDNPLQDDYAYQDNADTDTGTPDPPPTVDIDDSLPPRPADPWQDPEPIEIEEQTIGQTIDELPEAPHIGSPDARETERGQPRDLSWLDNNDDDRSLIEPDSEAEKNPSIGGGPLGNPTEERPAPGSSGTSEEDTDAAGGDDEDREREPLVDEESTPAPEPEPQPRDTGSIPRTYKVQSGDTFASIALKFYGEERAWYDIAQANPSVDPKQLQIGQEIVLPTRDADPAPGTGTTDRDRDEVRPPAPGKDQTYTVRPGDNLSKIAQRFYGDADQWERIYARNRNKIGPRPNALKVGMELIIPQAYEGAE